jgi:hypothetical protein
MNKSLFSKTGLFVLVVSSFILFGAACGQASAPQQADAKTQQVAEALTASGAKLYGAWWCSHCQAQKELFSDAFDKLNYVECANPDSTQNTTCKEAGITSYPTWEFGDGTRVSSVLTMDQLIEKGKLKLPDTAGPVPTKS